MTELVIYNAVKCKYKGGIDMKLFKNYKQTEKSNITAPAIKSQDSSSERTLFLIKASRLIKNMQNFDFTIETNACYK